MINTKLKNKKVIFSFVLTALTALSIELASFCYLQFRYGINIWSKPTPEKIANISTGGVKLNKNLPGKREILEDINNFKNFSFNPLYGFQYNSDTGPQNNYFLNESKDLPYVKESEDEIVVGIFGGSVAWHFYIFLQSTEAKKNLENYFNGKKITFLNLSVPAMSQPQQFILSSLFIESFDVALNIDGHNEMAIKKKSYFPIEFPIGSNLLFLNQLRTTNGTGVKSLPVEVRQALSKLDEEKKSHQYFYENSWVKILSPYSHTALLLFFTFDKRYRNRILSLSETSRKIIFSNKEKSLDFSLEDRLINWSKFTKRQSLLIKGLGKKTIFFLQPNPYSKPNKKFSIEEREKLETTEKFRDELGEAYNLFHQETESLTRKGVNIYSLKDIFNSVEETVYVDNCCHLNQLGNQIMLESIAPKLLKTLEN